MKEYKYKINGNDYNVAIGDIEDGVAQVEVNGTPYRVELEKKNTPVTVIKTPKASPAPRTVTGDKVISKPVVGGAGHKVVAPLPGTVLQVLVNVGDTVKASDTVIVLEAMKMENAVLAGRDGKVTAVNVKPNDAVLEGTALVTIE